MPTPTPSLVLNFTAGVPSSVTFARNSAAKAIQAGLLISLASAAPAIESWDGVTYGLRLGPAISNLLKYSNQFADSNNWAEAAVTAAAGGLGPDGVTSMTRVQQTTNGNVQGLVTYGLPGTNGQRMNYSVYARVFSGSLTPILTIVAANQNNSAGMAGAFALQSPGPGAWFQQLDTSNPNMILPRTSIKRLANGIFHCSLTATQNDPANGLKQLSLLTGPDIVTQTYNGRVGDGLELFGAQVSVSRQASGYLDNPTTAGASMAAETAAVAFPTGWSATTGTLMIEHDSVEGTLIGSGTNVIASASGLGAAPGKLVKTIVGWDSSGSYQIDNGGAPVTGPALGSLFATNLLLLGTSAVQDSGHVRTISFFNGTKLSITDAQAVSGIAAYFAPGQYQAATTTRLPQDVIPLTVGNATPTARVRIPLYLVGPVGATYQALSIRIPNFVVPDEIGDRLPGNSVKWSMALETATGTSTTVPITFGGTQSVTIADGASSPEADAILVSSFPGVSAFTVGEMFYLRGDLQLPFDGANCCGSAWVNQINTNGYPSPTGFYYNPANLTATSVNATGPFTTSGTGSPLPFNVTLPGAVLIGKFAGGIAPPTAILTGDSILVGIGTHGGPTGIELACIAAGVPSITACFAGIRWVQMATSVGLQSYWKYGRIAVDEYGRNGGTFGAFFQHTANARLGGIEKIWHLSTFLGTASVDQWTTAAGQTGANPGPINFTTLQADINGAVTQGYLDGNYLALSVTDPANRQVWITNGTPFYATVDGTHPSAVADQQLLGPEYTPVIAAITVSPPISLSSFTLVLNPTSLTVHQGGLAAVSISYTTSNGFTGSVVESLPTLPAGLMYLFGSGSLASTTASDTLSIAATTSAATGTSTVNVGGTSGSTTATAPLALTIATPSTAGVIPATTDVRTGVAVGSGSGTCHVPTAAQTLSGIPVDATAGSYVAPPTTEVASGYAFGVAGASIGSYVGSGGSGSGTYPAANMVLSTAGAYGPTNNIVPNFVLPPGTRIQAGTLYGPNGNGLLGSFDPVTNQFSNPGENNVAHEVSYLYAGVVQVGTLADSTGSNSLSFPIGTVTAAGPTSVSFIGLADTFAQGDLTGRGVLCQTGSSPQYRTVFASTNHTKTGSDTQAVHTLTFPSIKTLTANDTLAVI